MKFLLKKYSQDFIRSPLLKKTRAGFTLIEILVVIAIIGILTTLVVLNYNDSRAKARDAKRKQDLSTYQNAIEAYFDDYNVYPDATNSFEAAVVVSGCPNAAAPDPNGPEYNTLCNNLPGRNPGHSHYLQTLMDDPLVSAATLDPDNITRKLWQPRIGNFDVFVYFRYAYVGGGQTTDGVTPGPFTLPTPCEGYTNAFTYILSAGIENALDNASTSDGGRNQYRYEVGNARRDVFLCGACGAVDPTNNPGYKPYGNLCNVDIDCEVGIPC